MHIESVQKKVDSHINLHFIILNVYYFMDTCTENAKLFLQTENSKHTQEEDDNAEGSIIYQKKSVFKNDSRVSHFL